MNKYRISDDSYDRNNIKKISSRDIHTKLVGNIPPDNGLSEVLRDLKERENEYVRIGDIVDRFTEVNEYYNNTPWTLKQILNNINILMSEEISK